MVSKPIKRPMEFTATATCEREGHIQFISVHSITNEMKSDQIQELMNRRICSTAALEERPEFLIPERYFYLRSYRYHDTE
jgi:hypothetical protein